MDVFQHIHTNTQTHRLIYTCTHRHKNTVQTHASVFIHTNTRTLHPITKANARIGLKRAE